MQIQKSTLFIIIAVLTVFVFVGLFFCCNEHDKIIRQLAALVSQPRPEKVIKEEPATPPAFAPGRLLIRFKDNVPEEKQKKLLSGWGFEVKNEIKPLKIKIVSVPEEAEEALAKALSKNPNIEWAEPDYLVEEYFIPNDPNFTKQWALPKIKAPEAWDITKGNNNIKIAILDTGIDLTHPDLANKIINSINFTDSTTTSDMRGHGTHVAGISAAITNNGIGVAGVGYDSSIMNVKVLGDGGTGYWSWVSSGITWATDNGANVINMSLGGSGGSSTLESAVNYAWNKGVVVVAAAGNSATTTPMYPAYYKNSIAVAATDSTDKLASFSNYGDWVDVAAPGVSIYSTYKDGAYASLSGTSMASPHVAGLAGLLFAITPDKNGNGFKNDEVRFLIESTTDPIVANLIANGRINAFSAVLGTTTLPTPPPDTTPPTVSIVSPKNGDTVSGTISVNISASDNVGVVKVELYKNGTLFGTDETSPYSFAWDTTKDPDGNYRLQAKAYDTSGNYSFSSEITVKVYNVKDTTPPTVTIKSPENNFVVPSKGKILIDVAAEDNVGVTQIDILMDGKLITSCYNTTTCFVNFNVTRLKPGAHTITAQAFDAQLNRGEASVTIYKK